MWEAIRRGPSVSTPLRRRVSPAVKTPAAGNRSLALGEGPEGGRAADLEGLSRLESTSSSSGSTGSAQGTSGGHVCV
jgi:hypothetical protein